MRRRLATFTRKWRNQIPAHFRNRGIQPGFGPIGYRMAAGTGDVQVSTLSAGPRAQTLLRLARSSDPASPPGTDQLRLRRTRQTSCTSPHAADQLRLRRMRRISCKSAAPDRLGPVHTIAAHRR